MASITEAPLRLDKATAFNADEKKVASLVQQLDNNTTLKAKVPLCYGDDLESLIQTVVEFREVAEELIFDTEQEKFTHRKCLKNTARNAWDEVKILSLVQKMDSVLRNKLGYLVILR